jgi:raffinose/stachyose/melibiose transport system substrate-binding protein
MKKRIISAILSVAMVVVGLAGCQKDDKTSSKEISMFISQPEYADAINTLIEEYKKVEPDVVINYETTQNDYPTLLKTKLNSNSTPDIFASTSGKEIETYKEYSFDLSDQPLAKTMLPAVANSMRDAKGEGLYGLAIKGNYFGLIYNLDLLQQAGVEKMPETLTELKECVDKLEAIDVTPFTGGFAEWWTFKHAFQHFLDAASDDVPALVQSLEKGEANLSDYPSIAEGYFEYIDIVKDNGDPKPLEADLSAEISAFSSGKAAIMSGQGAWVEADILKVNPNIKIGFSGYPVSENPEDCKVITGADQALRINKDSKNLDAVLDFINWWYTSDYGKAWFTDVAGVVPPIEVDKESEYEIVKQGANQVAEKGSAPLSIIYSTDSFYTSFGETMQAYVGGQKTKEETLKTIQEKWQEIDGAN